MKKNTMYILMILCFVSSVFIGCEAVAIESVGRAFIKNEVYKFKNDLEKIKNNDKFKFKNSNINYIYELNKEDLKDKFGESTLVSEGISGKGINCEIYNFNKNEITAAIDKETKLVQILTFYDNSIEHIKNVKIGETIDVAISKILGRADFDIDSAKKILEWDGGYYSELYGDIEDDMVHSYSITSPIGYIVYQNFEKGYTQIVLKDKFYEITISIENNLVSSISYAS